MDGHPINYSGGSGTLSVVPEPRTIAGLLTGGVALGRASYATTATLYENRAICVVADCTTATNPWPFDSVGTASNAKTNALIYGWSAGAGIDYALTQNIFVRAEYEFIQFSQMRLNLNSARVGAGLKF